MLLFSLAYHLFPFFATFFVHMGVVHLFAASERRTQWVGVSRGQRRAGRRRSGGIHDASQKAFLTGVMNAAATPSAITLCLLQINEPHPVHMGERHSVAERGR